jgi:WD40 repeat protein
MAPAGQLGLSGGWDGNLRLWNLERGVEHKPFERIETWKGLQGVSRVVFSPDGRRLLSCTGEESARLWDVTGGQPLQCFRMPPDIWDIAFSADGERVFGSGGSGVAVWTAETGEEMHRIAIQTGTWGLALAQDERWLVTGGRDQKVHLWDVASGRELSAFTGHRSQVHQVALSPDRRRLLSAGEDRTVRLWDLDTGRELERLEGHTEQVWSVAFSPTGRQAASSDDAGFVRLYDVSETGARLRLLPHWHSGSVRSLAFAPDGETLASAGHDGRIILWDVAKQAKEREWQLPGPVLAVAFAPDGKHLAAANSNGTFYVLRIGSRQ